MIIEECLQYQDFLGVSLFSVIEYHVGPIVQDQLHSFCRPCCSQHLQTEGTGQLACSNAHLRNMQPWAQLGWMNL